MIHDALQKYGVEFSHEKSFEDLRGISGRKLRFDFAVYRDGTLVGLIEHQGQQHYWPVFIQNKEYGRRQREETDQQKREYCAAKQIPLFEIRYDDDIDASVRNIITQLHLI